MNVATKAFIASTVAAASMLAAPAASAAGEAVSCKVTATNILSRASAVRTAGFSCFGYSCSPDGSFRLTNGEYEDWLKSATNRRSPVLNLYGDFLLDTPAVASGNLDVELRPSRQFSDAFKSLEWYRITEPQQAKLSFNYSQLAAGPITRSVNLPVMLTRGRVSTVVAQVTCARGCWGAHSRHHFSRQAIQSVATHKQSVMGP